MELLGEEYLAEYEPLYQYSGEIQQSRLEKMVKEMRSILGQNKVEQQIQRRINSVFVELVQNIILHGYAGANVFPEGEISIAKWENQYHIVSGNYIQNTSLTKFLKELDRLNIMEKKMINQLKWSCMQKTGLYLEQNAGIGLLEILSRADSKIQYEWHSFSEQISVIILKVIVGGSNCVSI
ncbi:DUF6272 family protein [Velocimicrobium porci]|mgnify:CR=1 FL=1|uniref:ATP-binding protein n=1 Tax=Velocimicrobium porci TaxID=2606634 RepID=A0A6L5XYP1_9FIRM|nr:DUF6272 family protein [Velocimicrobium porci]MSS63063.1 hypothetical protein [Velocimicrobium porci]